MTGFGGSAPACGGDPDVRLDWTGLARTYPRGGWQFETNSVYAYGIVAAHGRRLTAFDIGSSSARICVGVGPWPAAYDWSIQGMLRTGLFLYAP